MSLPVSHLPVPETVRGKDVWAIVEQVWESLLQAPALPAEADLDATPEHDLISAVVRLDGTWTGAVSVTCSVGTAASLATVMLLLTDDEEPTREDVEDALGELVNVVGGNVKALVQRPTKLSLPSVGSGRPLSTADEGGVLCRLAAGWQSAPVEVLVTELSVRSR